MKKRGTRSTTRPSAGCARVPDPLEGIKRKELYDTLEGAIDECGDVANVLETISIKHA